MDLAPDADSQIPRDIGPVARPRVRVELPALMTVPEAAAFLRIGRTAAYDLAKRYEESDGAEGLPVMRIGRALRVPTARLEEKAGGPFTSAAVREPRTTSTTEPDVVDAVQLAVPSTAA